MARLPSPWSDLEEYAEALLKAEAERRGCGLREMGILSHRRQAHIRKYEIPMSLLNIEDFEDESSAKHRPLVDG